MHELVAGERRLAPAGGLGEPVQVAGGPRVEVGSGSSRAGASPRSPRRSPPRSPAAGRGRPSSGTSATASRATRTASSSAGAPGQVRVPALDVGQDEGDPVGVVGPPSSPGAGRSAGSAAPPRSRGGADGRVGFSALLTALTNARPRRLVQDPVGAARREAAALRHRLDHRRARGPPRPPPGRRRAGRPTDAYAGCLDHRRFVTPVGSVDERAGGPGALAEEHQLAWCSAPRLLRCPTLTRVVSGSRSRTSVVERVLHALVERGGGLVEEDHVGRRSRMRANPRRCCSPGESVVTSPISSRWSARWPSWTSAQHLPACVVGRAPTAPGRPARCAGCPAARRAAGSRRGRGAERPGDDPAAYGHSPARLRSSVVLPLPDGPLISSESPAAQGEVQVVDQRLAVGQAHVEVADLEPAAVVVAHGRQRAGLVVGVEQAGQPVERRRGRRRSRRRPSGRTTARLHLAECGRGLLHVAEGDLLR